MENKTDKIECNYCNKGCVGAFECWDCNGTGYLTKPNSFDKLKDNNI